jgi:GNAT superfamily N-acetyltransferase
MPDRLLPDLALRSLTENDLAAAYGLSAAVQWPHRLEDWRFALQQGQGVAATQQGVLVGTAMAWPFGDQAAGIGLVIVAQALQGRGLGRQLMRHVIALAGEERTLMLHATVAGQALYRSLGFVPGFEVRQHQGTCFAVELAPLPAGARLRPLGRSDFAPLLALDRAATGFDRASLLTAMLDGTECIVLDQDGAAHGFALRRRFGRGHVVGPVIAPDGAAARAMIGHFLGRGAGQFTRLDVPEGSGLGPWLAALGLAEVGRVVRMLRGGLPAPAGPACFALASQAFG